MQWTKLYLGDSACVVDGYGSVRIELSNCKTIGITSKICVFVGTLENAIDFDFP